MLFDEYIKIFEEILACTEKIEQLCMKGRSDETDELFHKRNGLMKKLEIPEDLDNEKFEQVIKIKDKISEKNQNILNAMQREKELAQKMIDEMRKRGEIPQETSFNIAPSGQSSLKNPPKAGGDDSIFK